MTTPPRSTDRFSPNQLAKRDAIVAAAVAVLVRDGVHGCTVRSIAGQAGMSKGTVHYYFRDVDEIVDAAMLRATRAWIAWFSGGSTPDEALGPVSGGAAGQAAPASRPEPGGTPVETLWRSLDACLEPFAHGDRALMPLWLEYWAARTRSENVAPLGEMHSLLLGYVADLLSSAGIGDVKERASGVVAYLLGEAMQEAVRPIDRTAVREHLSDLCGLSRDDLPSAR